MIGGAKSTTTRCRAGTGSLAMVTAHCFFLNVAGRRIFDIFDTKSIAYENFLHINFYLLKIRLTFEIYNNEFGSYFLAKVNIMLRVLLVRL